MIAFPGMLVACAEKAGMKVPPDPNDFSPEEYPHFNIFCTVQLGAPMPHFSAHWDNAVIVAAIADEQVKTITYGQLLEQGLAVGYSR